MSGYVFIGGRAIPNSWVSDRKMIQIRYSGCPLCLGQGVIMDDNDEPQEWCDCTIGEACRQAGSPRPGGAS